MTITHDIWLIAMVIETVIGVLEVAEKGKLTIRELFLWRIPRIVLAPFAIMARFLDGLKNFEITGNVLWEDKEREIYEKDDIEFVSIGRIKMPEMPEMPETSKTTESGDNKSYRVNHLTSNEEDEFGTIEFDTI